MPPIGAEMSLFNKFYTDIFSKLLIKHKVWLGFAIMLVILVVIAIKPLHSLTNIQKNVVGIVTGNQTTVIESDELAKLINEATSHLGFYLMSQEDHHKHMYEQNLKKIDEQIQALKNNNVIKASAESVELVNSIEGDIKRFKEYGNQTIEIVKDDSKNYAAVAYSSQNLSPLAQQILQHLTAMILTESSEESSAKRKALLIEIDNLRYNWVNLMSRMRGYLVLGSDVVLKQVKNYAQTSGEIIGRINEMEDLLTLDQLDALEQITSLRNKYVEGIKEVENLKSSGKWRTDAYLIRTELGPLLNDIRASLDKLVVGQRQAIEATSNELLGQVQSTIYIVAIFLVIGLLIGTGVAWLMSCSITRPLRDAVTAMNDIAEGEGDLTRRLAVRGRDEIAQLSAGFNKFVEKIQNLIGQLIGFTSQLASATNEMSAITEQTSVGAKQQQEQTDQVVSAINELMRSVQEVASSASEAASAAQHANDETGNGQKVVAATVQSINSLANEVERAGGVIQKLGKESENIGSVLDVIRGIAEQTNLLALNAAIEAARAGEQGRGFAVVADEVRTLASRTQQSTQEIQEMIQRLQSGAREAVSVMEEGQNMAKASVDQAAQAGSSLDVIAGAVSTISTMNTQIASAAEEQSSVSENINCNVQSISDITDQTTEGSHQTARASEDLNKLAVELQQTINQFKI
jgi:methyl-accepting chemotaxis protein